MRTTCVHGQVTRNMGYVATKEGKVHKGLIFTADRQSGFVILATSRQNGDITLGDDIYEKKHWVKRPGGTLKLSCVGVAPLENMKIAEIFSKSTESGDYIPLLIKEEMTDSICEDVARAICPCIDRNSFPSGEELCEGYEVGIDCLPMGLLCVEE